jgi:DNA primase
MQLEWVSMADSEVQEIKDKLSINEVVGQYVTLRRAGRNFVAPCPFHKERTPSFHVSPERGSYMCFGCGEKGDIFSFVQKMDGVDFVTALKQLAKQAGVELKPRQFSGNTTEDKNKEERLFEVCEAATNFFESVLKNRKDIQDYLHARGVHDDTIALWRIGYAPASWEDLSTQLLTQGFTKDEIVEAGLAARSERKQGEIYDRFRGRIMFPLFDAGGKVIAFSGRFFEKVTGSHEESEPAKYVNSPETALFKKSRVLYGYDRAKNSIRKNDCILLVEGQFDVILSHQSGLPFTVAISGTALTPEHLSLLGRLSKRLVLALDGDAAGIRAGLKSSVMALAQGFDVKIPTFEGGKDPADLAKENPELLKAAVRTSKTAVEFFLEALRRGAKDQRSFKTVVHLQLFPLVQAMPSLVTKAHFISILSQWLDMPESEIRIEVAKARSALVATDATVVDEKATIGTVLDEPLTLLESSVGMLLYRFESDISIQNKLEELLGEERLSLLKEKLRPQAERLYIEFNKLSDSSEEEGLRALRLEKDIEKIIIEEEMREVKQKLYAGGGESAALVQQLAELKRREQQLRK